MQLLESLSQHETSSFFGPQAFFAHHWTCFPTQKRWSGQTQPSGSSNFHGSLRFQTLMKDVRLRGHQRPSISTTMKKLVEHGTPTSHFLRGQPVAGGVGGSSMAARGSQLWTNTLPLRRSLGRSLQNWPPNAAMLTAVKPQLENEALPAERTRTSCDRPRAQQVSQPQRPSNTLLQQASAHN